MHQNKRQSQKNLKAIAIGFLFIVLAILIIFAKPLFFGEKDKTDSLNKTASLEKQPNLNDYLSISADDLLKKIKAGEEIKIIDLRMVENFAIEHLAGSKNFSLQNIKDNFTLWDKDKEYILVDDLGLTPQEIEMMEFLSVNGFSDVAYLEGGFFEWKNRLNPTVNQGNPYSFTDQSKVNYIKSDDLKKIMSEENNLYIIDVRKNSLFAGGHINGAVNIFLEELESRYREIPLGKKIILYDNDGIWAFQAAVRLFDLGIMNAYALSDGLNTWKQKGYELVR